MNPLTLTNAFFSPLFLDGTVARAFSTEATLAASPDWRLADTRPLGKDMLQVYEARRCSPES